MGITTNNLLDAGDLALQTEPSLIPQMKPLRDIKQLHRATVDDLGVDDDAAREVRPDLRAALRMARWKWMRGGEDVGCMRADALGAPWRGA